MLIVKFANLEIGSAAARYRTSMAKYLPKPLRTLYRGGRAWAVNGVTSSNAAAVSEIKRQCQEKSDFGHTLALCKFTSRALRGGIVLIGEKHQGSLSIATSGTFLARPSEENGLVCRVFAAKSQRSRPRADIWATVVTGRREWTCRSLSSQRCCWN